MYIPRMIHGTFKTNFKVKIYIFLKSVNAWFDLALFDVTGKPPILENIEYLYLD